MRGLITAEKIAGLVSDYHNKKSLLIKASNVVRGKIVKFNIFPVDLAEVRDFLKYSDESECCKYEVISEGQLRELRNHPDCSNSEAINLFCTELLKLSSIRYKL